MSLLALGGAAIIGGVAPFRHRLWRWLRGLIEWEGREGSVTVFPTETLSTLGGLAIVGMCAYFIVGGHTSTGGKAGGVIAGTPGTPTITVVRPDTSTMHVTFSPFSANGADTQDSISVTVLRSGAADTLFHAISGVQSADTVSDNADLKADTTYRVLGRQKGLEGGWSVADTLNVTMSTWPDNEPASLSAVYTCHPTDDGILADGSALKFDYSGAGGGNCETFYGFGGKWGGDTLKVVSRTGSKYGSVIQHKFYSGWTSDWHGIAYDDQFANNYDTLYMRMVFRYSTNWQIENVGDKLWYFGGNGMGSAFYVLSANLSGDSIGRIRITNQASSCGACGDILLTGDTIRRNEWNTVEVMAISQSAVNVADGQLKVWLNNTALSFGGYTPTGGSSSTPTNLTNIMWYATGASTRYFSGNQLFLYWGGGGDTKAVTDTVDLSEYYVTGSVGP